MNLRKFYTKSFMQDMTAFGTLYHFAVLIAVLVSFGQHDIAYKLAAGQAIMYVIGIPLKLFFFKDRPSKIVHKKNFLEKSSIKETFRKSFIKNIKNIIEKIEASSFPSVHALRIFFVSTALINYFNNLALSFFLLAVSLIVAYSRIYLRRHYYSDVIAGAVIGIALGYVINYV